MGGPHDRDVADEREKLPTEAMLALQSGRKIDAVRIVHEQTGLGLRESRRLVERAERDMEPGLETRQPGKEDSGVLRLIVIVVILGAVAAAIFLL